MHFCKFTQLGSGAAPVGHMLRNMKANNESDDGTNGAQSVISTLDDAVAATLRAERAASDLTLTALVARSGVPERTLVRLLKGERTARVDQIHHLAAAFGVDPGYIMNEAERRLREAQRSTKPNDRDAQRISELQRQLDERRRKDTDG
jgi:transcriptional regulator with XRE-family HTH domain